MNNIPEAPKAEAVHLLALTADEWDALPFGAIRLDRDGTVVAYNAAESAQARRAKATTVGKSFFRDVAPCTQGPVFEGRFRAMMAAAVPATASFDYDFAFPWGTRHVRIRLLVDGERNGWVFVTPSPMVRS